MRTPRGGDNGPDRPHGSCSCDRRRRHRVASCPATDWGKTVHDNTDWYEYQRSCPAFDENWTERGAGVALVEMAPGVQSALATTIGGR